MSEPKEFSTGLSVRDVAVARGGRTILEGATFDLAPGAALFVKGANGSGKTTLLRALAGLAPIESGEAHLTPEGSSPAARRAAIVYCGHANAVKAAVSGRANLAFWAALYGAPKDRAEAAIEAFDLAAFVDAPAGALSQGQRRRLALSRLILSAKPLWLLDEPSAAIDAASAARLSVVIAAHRARGGAVMVATHDGMEIDGARTLTVHARAA